MERVLVLGGSGMVGHALKKESEKRNVNEEWIFASSKDCDLTNREATLSFFNKIKPTFVIHLAAKVGGLFHNLEDKVGFLRDNLRINENVLEGCNSTGVEKGIFFLSSCIFPANPAKYPMEIEDLHSSPPHFSNESYAYAKRLLEVECRNYNIQYNRKYVCLPAVNLYGENDNYHLANSHVIPGLIHKTYLAKKSNTPLVVSGTGKPLRQFVFSDDLAKIVCWMKDNIETIEKPVICCDRVLEYSISQVVDLITKSFNFKGEVVYDTSQSDGIYKKTVSGEYLHSLIPDFKFTLLENGINASVEWFTKNYDVARK